MRLRLPGPSPAPHAQAREEAGAGGARPAPLHGPLLLGHRREPRRLPLAPGRRPNRRGARRRRRRRPRGAGDGHGRRRRRRQLRRQRRAAGALGRRPARPLLEARRQGLARQRSRGRLRRGRLRLRRLRRRRRRRHVRHGRRHERRGQQVHRGGFRPHGEAGDGGGHRNRIFPELEIRGRQAGEEAPVGLHQRGDRGCQGPGREVHRPKLFPRARGPHGAAAAEGGNAELERRRLLHLRAAPLQREVAGTAGRSGKATGRLLGARAGLVRSAAGAPGGRAGVLDVPRAVCASPSAWPPWLPATRRSRRAGCSPPIRCRGGRGPSRGAAARVNRETWDPYVSATQRWRCSADAGLVEQHLDALALCRLRAGFCSL
mmetsp:Transcript_51754/g.150410  ORF Transcript_51754/g.150410 Transcript_51754/m.150410 type:complete len:374 (+) Transcript_51754:262-1383(+)